MKIPVSIVVAIDEKRGIGKNNDLLFKIPDDLKRFRQLTKGHAIIMGRKTYDSIGRPLPGRLNIVLSRDLNKTEIGEKESPLYFRDNLKQAFKEAIVWEDHLPKADREIFIIGGAQIFKIALDENLVDRIYLTIVKGDYHADTFFPEYESLGFKKIEEENKESVGYQYANLTLEK